MNNAELKALKAINRISRKPVKAIRRFWTCDCGYKTIGTKCPSCRDCGVKMKAGRII